MKLLALDFDGVISDSAREAYEVARRTYLDLRPDAPLGSMPAEEVYRRFLEIMPLGNRAEDYATALVAIEAGVELPDQGAYDAFRRERDAAWLRRFHRRFYEVRHAFAARDPAGWRALLRPYRRFLEILRRRAGEAHYAIATAKDRRSVGVLLEEYGVADLFPAGSILDKETGESKRSHLEHLHRVFGIPFGEMTFVDDKVNHLDAVAPLGVRGVLAGWGYNGPREHALARAHGHRIGTLDNVEDLLFSGR